MNEYLIDIKSQVQWDLHWLMMIEIKPNGLAG